MKTSEKYHALFDSFRGRKVMIIGDVMVDSYLWGRVDRISPEAPVPVVALQRRENRLGGAANVALNIQAMGATPLLCSVTGEDRQGDIFSGLLNSAGMRTDGILKSKDRITTTKFRIIGNKSQMLRVDEEILDYLSEKDEHAFLRKVQQMIAEQQPPVLIFQDYNKGLLTTHVIQEIIHICQSKGILVCVDPKKDNFANFRNVSLFKPNLKELKEGLKTDLDPARRAELDAAVKYFQERQQINLMMVTLSEHGILVRSLDQDGESQLIPAHKRNIADVSGAGDTVISVAALCLSSDCTPAEIAGISNLAGGLVCEEVGVVPVDRDRLLNEVCLLKQA